jgi:hypothetical protein
MLPANGSGKVHGHSTLHLLAISVPPHLSLVNIVSCHQNECFESTQIMLATFDWQSKPINDVNIALGGARPRRGATPAIRQSLVSPQDGMPWLRLALQTPVITWIDLPFSDALGGHSRPGHAQAREPLHATSTKFNQIKLTTFECARNQSGRPCRVDDDWPWVVAGWGLWRLDR